VRLTDIGETYTIELSETGARAIEGEMIDFPHLTLEATAGQWDLVMERAEQAVRRLEQQLREDPPDHRITEAFLRDLERHDAVLEVELTGGELAGSIEATFILNDYEAPPGASRVRLSGRADRIVDVLEGRRRPADVVRGMDVGGDYGLALELSGLVLEHFPQLDD
jgi:hypothetical protein